MKRTDITPGTEYLIASGADAIAGRGYNRRKAVVLSTTPHYRTRPQVAVPESRTFNGRVIPGTPAVPAATVTFDGPEGPVTVDATPSAKGGLPALMWVQRMIDGDLQPGEWIFTLVSSREVVDTWEHAEQVLADNRRKQADAAAAARVRKSEARTRFDALDARLNAVGIDNPMKVDYNGRLVTAEYGADVAAVLEALLDLLDATKEA